MSFSNRLNPGCQCCGPRGVSIQINAEGPCNHFGGIPGAISDGPVFGGTLHTSITHDGTDISTTSTFTEWHGNGTYVFTVTSTSPYLTIDPASVTVTATDDGATLTYSGPQTFTLGYDRGESVLCCDCSLPTSVHVEPTDASYADASYNKYISGPCNCVSEEEDVFEPQPYSSGTYCAQDLTFTTRPPEVPTGPINFLGQTGGGTVTLPDWDFYSGSFSITQHPDDYCGWPNPCLNPCPDQINCACKEPRTDDPAATVTGWYWLRCSNGGASGDEGLSLWLVKKTEGQTLDCDFDGNPSYHTDTFWLAKQIWQWTAAGVGESSTCDPLYLHDGWLNDTPDSSPQPVYMELTPA